MTSNGIQFAGPDIKLNRFLAPFIKRQFQRKLVLIHCPTFNFETFQFEVLRKKGYYAYPPRALQCLSVAVRDLEVKTDILDLNFRMLEKLMSMDSDEPVDLYKVLIGILDEYLENNPEVNVFGVSTGVIVPNIFLAERHPFLEVLKHLMGKERGLVLAGGPCATIEVRNLVQGKWAHAGFKGEAEDRLHYFLGLLFGENAGPSISGICFLDGDQYTESIGTTAMVDFKGSLIDTYMALPVERYHTVGCLSPFSRMAGTDKPYASLQLIRGCRMSCTFCGLSQYRGSNTVCQYPTDVLFDEIEYLVRQRGIRHFEWLDEDLLANRSAIFEILQRIADADFKITWAADIGLIAVYLEEPLLELMAKSGCVGFRIGVESGNEEMLKKIKKPATKQKLRVISRRLQKYPEFFVAGLYMLGFVGETYKQMFDTLEFAIELDLSWSHFCVYQEMKETELKVISRLDSDTRRAEYKDWLPSTQKVVGSSTVGAASQKTLSARELFQLPGDSVHANEVKQELWFAF
ncbi:MAG TPA: radical SAM protein, partial [Geobacteraceae bacterium]|nr:radical SAM protein [Geobacteraceae bacterium]